MKKIYYLLLAATATIGLASCNNEWEDEQFEQMVSFKAIPDDSGVTPLYVRYNAEGSKLYELPVLLSGSTMSTANRTVHIAVDPDTLKQLNIERYGTDDRNNGIKYQQLDAQYYSFPETVDIPAGEYSTVLPITFTLGGNNNQNPLDMSDKWILPLTIQDDPSYNYVSNPRKYYRKALMHITPFNDYSGIYGGTQLFIISDINGDGVVDDKDESTGKFTENEHKAYVVDDNTVFFYAGRIDGEDLNRKNYKVNVRFLDEGFEGTEDAKRKKLEIWCDNPDANFKLLDENPYYTVEEDTDGKRPFIKYIYITVHLSYQFEDYTTVPGLRQKFKVDGLMALQRELNTLIPDEDQQIQW